MRISSIRVKGLFGTFDHEIPLKSAERVTLIHGPNGFGKTVMLRMIAAFFQEDTSVFSDTPFDEFSITFDDGSSRIVKRKTKMTRSGTEEVELYLHILGADGSESDHPFVFAPSKKTLDMVDSRVPSPYLRSENGWVNPETNQYYTLKEILELFPRARTALPAQYHERQTGLPLGLDSLPQSSVFFIETNRLGSRESKGGIPGPFMIDAGRVVRSLPGRDTSDREESSLRVEYYSRDLVRRVKSVLADYAKSSQECDRTFPERLVNFLRQKKKALEGRLILAKMSEIEKKRRRLVSLGFLDSETGLQDLKEDDVKTARQALTIYVGDIDQKLRVFDGLADRVGKLMDTVNDRFKFKRLTFDREAGFRVLTDNDEAIGIGSLSSGEQHELVLLYELLFRVPQHALVLIDEPEISLHVGWQSRFLTDLIEMLELTDAYAIVATHSPVIIGPRIDLTVELKARRTRTRSRNA